ncbi:gamma carbonic anhydrase family protein [Roseomonas sp. CCTCC AB2023176]|uniref:gamma carbonic anhydrase family protein n=1 Tax=Roseomonas sp. CCTCC AB2023176 TaxID=3342640 RepID=UPI0035D72142
MPLYALDDITPTVPGEGRYWIAPDAHVIGNVLLGDEVGVWFGAVIRGDNEPIRIGDRTNIQDGAVLHSDRGSPLTIGADVTIGHRAVIHGCTVADGSLIGMGATLLNGARIGAGCLVGANALVTERAEFPDGSLIVGAPAKVVRSLGPGVSERLREAAAAYVANWRRFAGGLRPAG